METKLTVKERIRLLEVIPEKGNRLMMKAIQNLNLKVGFSSEELEKFNIKVNEKGQISWSADEAVDFSFSDKEIEIIEGGFEAKDKAGLFNLEMIHLEEKLGLNKIE